MSVKIKIDEGSLKMTMKSLDKKSKQINAAASEGLESVAIDILADSQATLKENKNIATGKLINSGKVKKNTDNTIDVGVFANTNNLMVYQNLCKAIDEVKTNSFYENLFNQKQLFLDMDGVFADLIGECQRRGINVDKFFWGGFFRSYFRLI